MANNTILIKARDRFTEERFAAAAITPGHLIELTAADQVQPHSAAAGTFAAKAFALEHSAVGRGIDDAYAIGDGVVYQNMLPGEVVYAILENLGNVAIGAVLESNGAGELQALTTGQPVAIALEAVNASGGAARIKVQIV